MSKSKKIGRQLLLKYSLVTFLLLLAMPILLGVVYQIFTNESLSIATFFQNIWKDIKEEPLFIIVQFLVTLGAIWCVGGIAGKLIIDQDYPKKVIGFFSFLILWIILFVSCTISAALINNQLWGFDGLRSATIMWLAFGLFPFLIAGIINGFTVGIVYGIELKNRK